MTQQPDRPPRASTTLLGPLREIVGERGIITDARDMEPYLVDWRRFYRGAAPAVVRPASTAEVAAVVRLCAEAGTGIVPQGGNTGMCGGATPSPSGNEIVLALSRMNRIREIDPLNNTLTAEAGCVLATVQEAALAADRYFPLSLGGEGSCQIGGNLATNAGGINVLRYGNARELALGLEAVLPDGQVWDGLRGLRKDNTGYDLRDVLIGSEGTLGIITAAVLKLFPCPRARVTALAAVADPAAAARLLARVRGACGERISAFEIMSRLCVALVLKHIPGTREPLAGIYPWYVLVEMTDTGSAESLREAAEAVFAAACSEGLAADALLAASTAQSQALWRLRETIPEASRDEGLLYRHDVSLPVSRVPDFIAAAGAALERNWPGMRVICFGHLGDGNLHYNCFAPGRRRDDPAAREATDVNDVVLDIVRDMGGSFSAEHGVGQAKRAALARYKSPVELALMHRLKRTFDPLNIMNPGKLLPEDGQG